MDAYEGLARAHMRQQVRAVAPMQAALSQLWDDTVDPRDFERSFLVFRERAASLVQAGHFGSARLADDYYARVLGLDKLPVPKTTPPHAPRAKATVLASLSAGTRSTQTQLLINRGGDPVALTAKAKRAMLRSAKRQILAGGRERLLTHHRHDPNIRGWARVSDGAPCAFCAMLVSRGPVYKVDTVRFRAHDGCGCSARLVTRNDPSGGWDDESRHYRQLWEQTGGGTDFRYALEHPEWAEEHLGVISVATSST